MKIDNPFNVYEHVRYTCKPSGGIGVVGRHTKQLEVPDNTEEVLIEVVNKGRSDADTVYAARIWSKWGVLDIDSHLKKVEIEAEVKASEERKQKEAERKAEEIRRRAEAKKVKLSTKNNEPVITEEMEDISSAIEKGIDWAGD